MRGIFSSRNFAGNFPRPVEPRGDSHPHEKFFPHSLSQPHLRLSPSLLASAAAATNLLLLLLQICCCCYRSAAAAIDLLLPHNPTGKVFSKEELEVIAEACCRWDCLAITDEVYEHITFDDQKHISLASLPGMQKRTIITSSLSKTFSVTGWRIGWAIAPAFAASAIRNIHVKITDSAPAPFQEAALTALTSPPEYFEGLKKVEYVKELIKEAGVVAVPGCGFFHTKLSIEPSSEASCSYRKRYVRFAFCKSIATLAAAAQKLSDLKNATRYEHS
ncbi:hypothetical protein SLEP1_g1419 [Rubroshorea leprosula]|uniref:Aminotransferase class I/classII large domain-containing protein n=1 Tax=Rubroshorea leprosula TaxID=152421 RepID=A0AAV5HKV3_9ROSI|nr:hypothetical protein SLEP1_g1419 [Rubroshorea leprosula]